MSSLPKAIEMDGYYLCQSNKEGYTLSCLSTATKMHCFMGIYPITISLPTSARSADDCLHTHATLASAQHG